MKLKVPAGQTSRILRVFAQDSSSTVGAGLTGLVFNSAGLKAYYAREGDASATAITLVTATAGTWTSSGFIVLDAANMPGVYELHLPNAALAAGAKGVHVMLYGATNMAPVLLEIELDLINYQDSVRAGLTALPNAAAGANGGLPLGDASGRVDLGHWLGSAPDALSSGKLPADLKLWLASAPAALSASGYVQAMLLRWLTDNAAGTPAALDDSNYVKSDVEDWKGAVAPANTGDAFARLGAPAGASVSADVAGVLAKTPDSAHFTNARGDLLPNLDAAVSSRQATFALRSGTAQAGAAGSVTLDSGASATDALYTDCLVLILSGTGAGQARLISAYTGSTKVAAVTPNWATAPDATSAFLILPGGYADVGAWLRSPPNALQSGRVDSYLGAVAGGVIAAASFAANALDAVWGTAARTLTAFGFSVTASSVTDKTGYALTGAEHTAIATDTQSGLTAQGYSSARAGYLDTLNGLVAAVWNALTSGLTTVGSVGKRIADDLDAAVSSRLASGNVTVGAYAAGEDPATLLLATPANKLTTDASGKVALTTTEHAAVATDVQTGLAAQGVTTARAGYLDTLNGIVAAVATAVWAAGTRTLTALGINVTVGGYATGQDPATLALDAAASGHNTAGTIGAKINAAGGSADPLSNPVPGSYAPGTAGYILGTNLNEPISSISNLSLSIPAASIAAVLEGSELSIQRGDTLNIPFTGLGSLVGRTKLWFTLKKSYAQPDSAAILQVIEGVGLKTLNGFVATSAHGSISVSDVGSGVLSVHVSEADIASLRIADHLVWDLQVLTPSGVKTLMKGTASVPGDVTQSVS